MKKIGKFINSTLHEKLCWRDDTSFAKATSWMWEDLECTCCAFWRGFTGGVVLTGLAAIGIALIQ